MSKRDWIMGCVCGLSAFAAIGSYIQHRRTASLLKKTVSELAEATPVEIEKAVVDEVVQEALEMKVDSHGRILIAREVLDDYQLDNEVTVIGVLDHFEIWDEGAYARYMLENGFAYDAPSKGKAA